MQDEKTVEIKGFTYTPGSVGITQFILDCSTLQERSRSQIVDRIVRRYMKDQGIDTGLAKIED